MSKAQTVLALAAERCNETEIALALGMDVRNVRRIIACGWWPWSRRRAA